MSDLEQQLQNRLEELEAGADLHATLIGLPEAEANALRLIDAMRQLPLDEPHQAAVSSQRAAVLEAAAAHLGGGSSPVAPSSPSFIDQVKAFFTPPYTFQDVSMGMAVVLAIAVIGVVWVGIAQNNGLTELAAVPAVSDPISEPETTAAEEPTIEELSTDPEEVAVAVEPAAGSAATAQEESVSGGAAAGGENPLFLPLLSTSLDLNPQTALIEVGHGVVELQASAAAEWVQISGMGTMPAGGRLRTADLSQATLTFYDGSQAIVQANSELSVDELNAQRPENGFRTVVMTQWVGESDHEVAFRGDSGSVYAVNTPSGSGIARGTRFHVLVTPAALVHYIVTEGKVDVTGLNRTVGVTAGQKTIILAGSTPAEPSFNVFGEGEVTAVGAAWMIAGQSFQTDENTIVIGNPQIGDVVQVNGHLLPDGRQVADTITLIRRAIVNRFALSGEVMVIGSMWEVAGQIIVVDDKTVVDDNIEVGDSVRISGLLLPGGTLQAETIVRLDEAAGLPFSYSGLVEGLNDDRATISGQTIVIDAETVLPTDLGVGDVVAVSGWIAADGSWHARTITRQLEALPEFEFSGVIESIGPWQVSGITFETRPWSVVPAGLAVGDRVTVRGTILPDGTRVVDTIIALDTLPINVLTIIGVIGSVDPWIVNGIPLTLIGSTQIIGEVVVGSTVIVQTRLLTSGRWEVVQIQPLHNSAFGLGCLTLSSPVIVVEAQKFKLKHWDKYIDRAAITGDLKVNSVVTLPLCTGIDGQVIIVGTVVVIYRPIVFIIDDGVNVVPSGCKITKKGKIKCSNKSS